jgi:TadE-like protein.
MKQIIKHSNRKLYAGSITVEAAFIMPIVIMTIFALLYLAFYLHDICRIRAETDLILYKAGITMKHDTAIATGEIVYDNIMDRGVFYLLTGNAEKEETAIRDFLSRKLSKGLLLVSIKAINMEVERRKVTVSVEVDTKVTLPGIKYLFHPLSRTMVEGVQPVHNPAETIRYTEVILDTGSKIKGVDELKKKIEDLLNLNN